MGILRIAFASDHAGFALKKKLVDVAAGLGHRCEDFGCTSDAPADASDHVAPAAAALGEGRFDRAVFVDGAGYGSAMVANFHHGVFCACCNDGVSARLAREHGGVNALALGSMVAGELQLREALLAFLSAEALPGKYAARREKVEKLGESLRLGPLFRRRALVTVEDLRDAILKKEPLVIDEKTVITPSVLDAVRGMRA